MGDATRTKVNSFVQSMDRRYGKVERPVVTPPPSSADAAAAASVSAKNSQLVAGVVLGLHGTPSEGVEAARKLMAHFVDWNEVRVSRPATLVAVLGKQTNPAARVTTLQRFLEAYFLRQRSLNLEYLFTLKGHEVKRFLSELEVFDREELAAVYLTGFNQPVFPPSETLRETSEKLGLLKPKTTALQMAKKFEDTLDLDLLYSLHSHLWSVTHDPEQAKLMKKSKG